MTKGKRVKVYVFPVGMADVELITKDEFDRVIQEGLAKGHTHCQFVCVGYCDRVVSFDSVDYKNISEDLEGYNVCAVKTGFPVYSNSNRFRYDPYISGVTERENNSFERGLLRFIMN